MAPMIPTVHSHLDYFGKKAKLDEGKKTVIIPQCLSVDITFLQAQFAPWYETAYSSILPQLILGVLIILLLQLLKDWGNGERRLQANKPI
jgi:hypothetical protein